MIKHVHTEKKFFSKTPHYKMGVENFNGGADVKKQILI